MFEVWLDEQQRTHFRLKGTQEDSVIFSKEVWTQADSHFGYIYLTRYDIIRQKYRYSWCSPGHPLVKAL